MFNDITAILGTDIVRRTEAIVEQAFTAVGSLAAGRAAIIDLHLAMAASILLRHSGDDAQALATCIDNAAERLKSMCAEARALR